MIQRLAHLDKAYTKEKDVKRVAAKEVIRKREAKIQEKRDVQKKALKKAGYKKKQNGITKKAKGI